MRRPATRPDRQPPHRVLVVDSSAVVAILFGEPSAVALLAQLAAYPEQLMWWSITSRPVPCWPGGATAIVAKRGAITDLDAFLDAAGIALISIDAAQARVALEARIRFGRGMGHGCAPNFGDTFAYALAKLRAAPLLYTGDDFSRTNIAAA